MTSDVFAMAVLWKPLERMRDTHLKAARIERRQAFAASTRQNPNILLAILLQLHIDLGVQIQLLRELHAHR